MPEARRWGAAATLNICDDDRAEDVIVLVSRFRSSQIFAAPSDANFGIKGTLANV